MKIKRLEFKRTFWNAWEKNHELTLKLRQNGTLAIKERRGAGREVRRLILAADAKLARFQEEMKQLSLLTWEKEYEDLLVLDGETWSLSVTFSDGSLMRTHGSNAYPQEWHSFLTAIENLLGKRPKEVEIGYVEPEDFFPEKIRKKYFSKVN